MKAIAIVLVSFVSALTVFSADVGKLLPHAASEALIRVIEKPQEFVGKPLRVAGIFSWGFEDERLFLTFDHFVLYDEVSAIDLKLDEKRSGLRKEDLDAYRGFRVKLEGVVIEETPRKEDVALARKGGFEIKPRYCFLFSRLLSYGPAGNR